MVLIFLVFLGIFLVKFKIFGFFFLGGGGGENKRRFYKNKFVFSIQNCFRRQQSAQRNAHESRVNLGSTTNQTIFNKKKWFTKWEDFRIAPKPHQEVKKSWEQLKKKFKHRFLSKFWPRKGMRVGCFYLWENAKTSFHGTIAISTKSQKFQFFLFFAKKNTEYGITIEKSAFEHTKKRNESTVFFVQKIAQKTAISVLGQIFWNMRQNSCI